MLFPRKRKVDSVRQLCLPLALGAALLVSGGLVFLFHHVHYDHAVNARRLLFGDAVVRLLRAGMQQTVGPTVTGLQATQVSDRLQVALQWQPAERSWRIQEVYRSRKPLLTAADLGGASLLVRLPATVSRFTDTVPAAGGWYYAVVIRNRYFRYPLIRGRNTLERRVRVAVPGLCRSVSLEPAGPGRVMIRWDAGNLQGGVRIYRFSGRPSTDLRRGELLGTELSGRGSYRDRPGPGVWSYAVVPMLHAENSVAVVPGASVAELTAASDGTRVTLQPLNGIRRLPFRLDPAGSAGYFLLPGERVTDLLNNRLQQQVRSWAKVFLNGLDNLLPDLLRDPFIVDRDRCVHAANPRYRYGDRYPGPVPARSKLTAMFTNRSVFWSRQGNAVRLVFPLTYDRYWAGMTVAMVPAEDSGMAVTLLLAALLVTAAGLAAVRYLPGWHYAVAVFCILLFVAGAVITTAGDLTLRLDRQLRRVEKDAALLEVLLEQSGLVKEEGKGIPMILPVLTRLLRDYRLTGPEGRLETGTDGRIRIVDPQQGASAVLGQLPAVVLAALAAGIGLLFLFERSFRRAYRYRTAFAGRYWWTVVLPLLLFFVLLLLLPVFWYILQMLFENPVAGSPATVLPAVRFRGLDGLSVWLRAGSGLLPLAGQTLLYVGGSVLGQGLLGLLAGFSLHGELRRRRMGKRFLLAPWALPAFISGLIWHYLLYRSDGALHRLVAALGGAFPEGPATARWLMLAVSIWYGAPFIMLAVLELLESIPRELYQMAELDGVGRFSRLFRISLPIVLPGLLPAFGLASLWTLNQFNLVYLFSGGDDRLDTIVTRMFDLVEAVPRGGFDSRAAGFGVLVMLLYAVYLVMLRIRDPERTVFVLRGRP